MLNQILVDTSGTQANLELSALVTATDSSVTTTGFGAYAVAARSGTLNMTGGSATTTNDFAFGLLSESLSGLPGTLSVNGVTVSTQGQSSQGTIVFGTGDTINISGSTVTTAGPNAFGLYAQNGGQSVRRTTRLPPRARARLRSMPRVAL